MKWLHSIFQRLSGVANELIAARTVIKGIYYSDHSYLDFISFEDSGTLTDCARNNKRSLPQLRRDKTYSVAIDHKSNSRSQQEKMCCFLE